MKGPKGAETALDRDVVKQNNNNNKSFRPTHSPGSRGLRLFLASRSVPSYVNGFWTLVVTSPVPYYTQHQPNQQSHACKCSKANKKSNIVHGAQDEHCTTSKP